MNSLLQQNKKEGKYYIIGFLRLRVGKHSGLNNDNKLFMPQLKNCALIRELHVYGNLQSCYKKNNSSNAQHYGVGKNLLKYAEFAAYHEGMRKIAITSGVGVRNYYRKRGYNLKGGYMVKQLKSIWDPIMDYVYVCLIIFAVSICINMFKTFLKIIMNYYY